MMTLQIPHEIGQLHGVRHVIRLADEAVNRGVFRGGAKQVKRMNHADKMINAAFVNRQAGKAAFMDDFNRGLNRRPFFERVHVGQWHEDFLDRRAAEFEHALNHLRALSIRNHPAVGMQQEFQLLSGQRLLALPLFHADHPEQRAANRRNDEHDGIKEPERDVQRDGDNRHEAVGMLLIDAFRHDFAEHQHQRRQHHRDVQLNIFRKFGEKRGHHVG